MNPATLNAIDSRINKSKDLIAEIISQPWTSRKERSMFIALIKDWKQFLAVDFKRFLMNHAQIIKIFQPGCHGDHFR